MRLRRGSALLLALSAIAGCQGGGELQFEWLRDGEAAEWLPEVVHFLPAQMVGPHARGFQRTVEKASDGRQFRWSRGPSSEFVLSVIELRQRRLLLEGFPMPHRDGRSQTVDVVLNGEWIGQLEWAAGARQEIAVPEGFLRPGRNRLELNYGHVAKPSEHLPNSADERRLAMAWSEVALIGARPLDSPTGTEPGVQRATSLLARWTPLVDGTRWRGEGVALESGAEFALWMDPGDGQWRELRRLEFAAGEELRFEEQLDLGAGEVKRCAIAMLDGGVRWRSIRSDHRADSERPPIVLITLDTTRRDALGSYREGARTPNLDRLAAEGIVFDRAYSVAPVTAPTHASIFLSQYPSAHGLSNNGRSLAPIGGAHLLAQAKAWGYRSAGFVSLGVLSSDLGFGQGFDHFDHRFDQGWWRFAAELNPHALQWISEHPWQEQDAPGFLWVHYADPHKPYGLRDEPGQGLQMELNGEVLGQIPSMGLVRAWELQLPAGRSELILRAPRDFSDQREHWYVLRDLRVIAGEATVDYGDGWQEVRGYRRMREEASFVLDSARAQTINLRLAMEDLPGAAEARRRYAQEVEEVDRALGELLAGLDAAGWLDQGIVAIVADHGEDLGENGHFGHVEHVGDTLMRIPWILWSRSLAPRRIEQPVSVIDLAPTLWGLASLPPDPNWDGVDVMAPFAERSLLLETFRPEAREHWRGVVQGERVVRLLEKDSQWIPEDHERGSLSQEQIEQLIAQWKVVEARDQDEISAEVEERLRALGYIR